MSNGGMLNRDMLQMARSGGGFFCFFRFGRLASGGV
jgi:hypothetical protein